MLFLYIVKWMKSKAGSLLLEVLISYVLAAVWILTVIKVFCHLQKQTEQIEQDVDNYIAAQNQRQLELNSGRSRRINSVHALSIVGDL